MSKIIKNVLMATFFSKFAAFDKLKIETAIGIFCNIIDGTGKAYFEKCDQLINGSDKPLKKYFSSTLELFFTDQSTACKDEINSLPDDIWSDETPSRANVQVFEVTQAASGTLSVKAGPTFKRVRAVFMFVAQTQSRLHAWNMFHDKDAKALVHEAGKEMDAANQVAKVDSQKAEDGAGDDTPDGDGTALDTSHLGSELVESIEGLNTALHAVTLNKEQVTAVCEMINEVTNHVASLGVAEDAAPHVKTKPAANKAASK